ncbi:TonB-dependent siderophore receptor [Phenylobacterium sp.]|uniref:TonB-dependent siderophore receptor n=1 Tax=Phenylobacterium sp. TaxID=1871053 RepID=UPI002FD95976
MAHHHLLGASLLAIALAWSGAAASQEDEATVGELTVIANDRAGLIERQPTDTVFGIDKPLIETARSASFASDVTLERYGIETVDDLVAVSPGAFTASFYNVPGSVAVRGTLAEIYFRGFKRIENRGTYPTLLSAVQQVEIVRGPPTAYQGPGKVGGFLNFVPKTAQVEGAFLTAPTGQVEVTVGSYDKKNLSAQIGLPASFGAVDGGVYLYGELEDSKSFYRGISPKHQLLQMSSDFSTAEGYFVAFGGMYYNSEGYVQTPGWNRLTQELVDSQTYIRGRDTNIVDLDGNGRLTPNEIGASLIKGYNGVATPSIDQRFVLDTGVGRSKISPRDVFISERDFSDTETQTYYFDIGRRFGDGQVVKAQLFYDQLKNQRFVSYGFPADYDTWVAEARLSHSGQFATAGRELVVNTVAGLSWRTFEGERKESTAWVALDRRDILTGAQPNDIIDDPFSVEPGGINMPWNLHNISKWHDRGAFAVADVMIYDRLNLVLSGRLDDYDVKSQDIGSQASAANRLGFNRGKGKGTYSLSASYRAPLGLMPYVTYAETAALEVSQAGDINPGQIPNGSWLSDSDLREVGLKGQWLDGALVASLSAYRQTRTRLNSVSMTVVGHRSKGLELEARWVVNPNFSLSFSGNNQQTIVKGPNTGFYYIPSYVARTPGELGFGGGYAVFSYATFPSRAVDYEESTVPDTVAALYATYTTDEMSWGQAGLTAGVKYVSETSGTVPGAVVYPDYATVTAAAYVARGPWMARLNIDNLFDKLYFTPVADVYANVAVLPGAGRQWRLTVQRSF